MTTHGEPNVVPFPKAEKVKSSTERIWGKAVRDIGYTGIPSIMIQAQRRLGVTQLQMNILIQLLDYLRDPTRQPFPRKSEIAGRMGVSAKTIQINIRALEQAGLLRREIRKKAAGDYDSNVYHLDGLIARVQALEPEFRKLKEQRQRARRQVEMPKGRRDAE
jgi:predicted transcriptional regulator